MEGLATMCLQVEFCKLEVSIFVYDLECIFHMLFVEVSDEDINVV